MAEIKDPAIPTAARASVGLIFIFPTIAVSVIDNKGSAIPEIIAGIASLLICRKEILGTLFNDLNVYQAKIKQLIWKVQSCDRFKVSPCAFFMFLDHRNSCGFFFDCSSFLKPTELVMALVFLISYIRSRDSFKPPFLFVFSSGLFFMFYGIFIISRTNPEKDTLHYAHRYASESLIKIRIVEELKNNDYYFKYTGEVVRVDSIKTRGKVLVRIVKNEKNEEILLGEEIFTSQGISKLKGPMNPGAFDFKRAMRKKGIYHQLTLKEDHFIRANYEQRSIKTRTLIYRNRLLKSLREKSFEKEEFSVMEALLLGRRQDLSSEMISNYQNAGAMHLLAISGLHIGILLIILNTMLKPIERFRYGKKIKLFVLISFLWFFAFLSGLSASVIRAVLMFSILSIGLHSKRKNNLSHYLFTSLFLSLIINPEYLFDLGFQLSYLAVISIVIFNPLIQSLWTPKHKITSYFWNLLTISFSAQIGILPLSLYTFHQFSALFFLSSLFIIPFLGVILGMGYLMIVLDHIGYLPEFYIEIYSWMIRMMNQLIGFLSGFEFLIYREVFFTISLLTISYLMILFFIFWIRDQIPRWVIASLITITLFITTVLAEKIMTQTSSELIVFHLYKESLVVNRSGEKGSVFENQKGESSRQESALKNYQRQHLSLDLESYKKMKNFFTIGDKRVLIVDHDNIKSDYGFEPDILILMNSPKINLNRLLLKIRPNIIVADGSNYFTYKLLWRRTAEKSKITFFDTAKNGAFTLANPS